MSITEPLRNEHADLLPHLAEFDTVAAGLHDWSAGTAQRLDGLIGFLRGHLLPQPGLKKPPSTRWSSRPWEHREPPTP